MGNCGGQDGDGWYHPLFGFENTCAPRGVLGAAGEEEFRSSGGGSCDAVTSRSIEAHTSSSTRGVAEDWERPFWEDWWDSVTGMAEDKALYRAGSSFDSRLFTRI
jgi:hypothetical protein